MNQTFQALADPTRRQILQLLQQQDMTAGEIAGKFEISKPSISHHLNALKTANLVLVERNGQQLIYSLNTSVVQEFIQELLELFKVGEDNGNHYEDTRK
jgi:ArsR family transcriptional regulator